MSEVIKRPTNTRTDVQKEIEARRGVVRNEFGEIVLNKEQLEKKIESLKFKVQDSKSRIKNCEKLIPELTAQLKSLKK